MIWITSRPWPSIAVGRSVSVEDVPRPTARGLRLAVDEHAQGVHVAGRVAPESIR